MFTFIVLRLVNSSSSDLSACERAVGGEDSSKLREKRCPRSSFQTPRDFLDEAGLVPLRGRPPSSEARPGVGGVGGPGEAAVGRWAGGHTWKQWTNLVSL